MYVWYCSNAYDSASCDLYKLLFVLAEKRKRFDSGEDPLDPESQQGGQGPFPFHGFNPFGSGSGGGFTYKFVFN